MRLSDFRDRPLYDVDVTLPIESSRPIQRPARPVAWLAAGSSSNDVIPARVVTHLEWLGQVPGARPNGNRRTRLVPRDHGYAWPSGLITPIPKSSSSSTKKCLKQLNELEEGRTSSCSKPGYGILPEDFWQEENFAGEKECFKAKQKWANAYRKHQIHYEVLQVATACPRQIMDEPKPNVRAVFIDCSFACALARCSLP